MTGHKERLFGIDPTFVSSRIGSDEFFLPIGFVIFGFLSSFKRTSRPRNTVSRREEKTDDRKLIVGDTDHAGGIVLVGLPVDVLQGLEDPGESRSVRHAAELLGNAFLQGGEGFPETRRSSPRE